MKIGVFANYESMEPDLQHLAGMLGCELVFKVLVMGRIVEDAVKMEQEDKVDAIVASGRAVIKIRPYISVPLVPQRVSLYNLILAFYKAKKLGKRIAYVDTDYSINEYKNVIDYDEISTIAGCKVQRYIMESKAQAGNICKAVVNDGCDVVVGTFSPVLDMFHKYGIKTVQIKVNEQNMISALESAINIVRVKNHEARKAGFSFSVINASPNGAFSLEDGRINIVNQQAEQLLGMSQSDLLGRSLEELTLQSPRLKPLLDMDNCMEMIKLGDTSLIAYKSKILDTNGIQMGTIYFLIKAQAVQEQELLIRKKSREMGFVATSTFKDIYGNSPAIIKAIDFAKRYATTASNILITGESGSGKDIFAQSIHNYSTYHAGPFLAINCASLPDSLLEAELFGYEEGSFTGASKGGKPGLLELAHRGTLFLDEIGEMPLQLQAKFLRVLQDKCVRRISGKKNIIIDVRIISATNKNLLEEIRDGKFRADLFYRINVLNIYIPPLRERKEDIRILVDHFAELFRAQAQRYCKFSPASYMEMERYDWPGNIRELYNFVERIVALARCNIVDTDIVREAIGNMADKHIDVGVSKAVEYNQNILRIPIGTMKEMEQDILQQLYSRYEGDKKMMEFTLKISNTTLWRRFKKA